MKLAIKILSACLALSAFTTFSCSSNKPIPDDMTAKELIQRGQEAYEKSRNKEALRYFNAVVDRYGSDPALYIEARYEIGHLYMKKKDYGAAVPVLEEIQSLYTHYPVGTFPAAYQKLANLELAKVPEAKLAEIHEKAAQEAALKQAEVEHLMQEAQSAEEAASADPQATPAEDEASAESGASADGEQSEAATDGGL